MTTDYVFATGDNVSSKPTWIGVLGVNITYQGKYRTLSNAHVLTRFDPKGIGNMIRYRSNPSVPFRQLFPVTGQVAVTYYTDCNQPNPVFNVMDIAWGDVTNSALVSTTINAVGGVSIQPSGAVRAPKDGEEFILGNYRFYKSVKIASLIAMHRSIGVDSSGAVTYSWWENAISFPHPGVGSGDSGTAMVASSDKAVIGLLRAISDTTGYGCPIV